MPSLFIGVYKALYPYTAQSDQELSLAPGDLLYLLEKSTEDDWWSVKKRVLGLETEEPTGLVPNNYIQPAPVVGRARALFDYDRQTEEELSFMDNDVFDVYDANDQDWILVGLNDADFGFVPSNYIEYLDLEQSQQQQQQQPPQQPQQHHQPPTAAPQVPVQQDTHYPPPQPQPTQPQVQVQHQNAQPAPAPQFDKPLPTPSDAYARPQQQPRRYSDDDHDGDNDNNNNNNELPPPKPARPNQQRPVSNGSSSPAADASSSSKSGFFSWQVQEVDGRKKHKATLAVGNGMIMYSPEKMAPQQWDAADVVNYSSEKKHVFLDFKNPTMNLDLHAGSKENVEEILSAIGEIHGASRAVGLREVYMAANSAGQQIGKVLYNFEAQGDDEVSAREGDNVFILDNKKSDQWWMVRTTNGHEGVMPSSYIEATSTQAKQPPLQRQNTKSKRKSMEPKKRDRSDKTPLPPSKPKPDMSKVRTWTDRSGTFKVDAALLGCAEGKIHLHKLNGVKIAVAAEKMSVDDLEYIERATGVTLDDDKPLGDVKRSRKQELRGVPGGPSTGMPRVASNNSAQVSQPNQSDYDWFGFFLDCGVDVNNCQRYAVNFNRDQMDDSVLEDINAQVLRNLGLKEGDILRVIRKLDERFDRRSGKEQQGGLFSEAGGVLKNNTTKHESKEQPKSLDSSNNSSKADGFEDDAWAVKSNPGKAKSPEPEQPPPKPARPNTTGQQKSAQVQTQTQPPAQPEPTGALKDLLTMQPLQPVKTSTLSNGAPMPTGQPQQQQQQPQPQQPPRASTMPNTPTQTTGVTTPGPLQQPFYTGNQVGMQTGRSVQQPLGPFATGNAQPLGPFATGNAQPLNQQYTGGAPPMQAQYTGGAPPMQAQYTGGAPPMQAQYTGGAPPPMQAQYTGGAPQLQNQFTGGSLGGPQSMNAQMAAMQQQQQQQPQPQMMPSNAFVQQPNAMQPFSMPLQQQPTNPYMQQQSYSTPNVNSVTAQFQQASLTGGGMQQPQQQMPMGVQQQPMGMNGVQQPMNGMNNVFGMQPQQPQQQQQPLQGQPTGFGFGNQGTGGIQPASQALGMDSNAQYSALQPQKTGPHPPVSFGGAQPLQRTPTGRRANLASATPTNPFGF